MITKVFSQLSTGPYDATRTDQQQAAVQYTAATTPPLGRDLLNGNAYEWNNCSPWRMLTTPVNTQDVLYRSEIIVLIQHPPGRLSHPSVIDIGTE